MNLSDIFVFLFLGLALLGVAYQSGVKAKEAEILHEGFEQELDPTTNIYMFYSLTSLVPGRKCRENYKLFKLNRHYTQLWAKFRQYLQNTNRFQGVNFQSVNVDENPEYIAEFDIESTPVIVIEQNGIVRKLNVTRNNLPSLNQVIEFYESVAGASGGSLSNYSEAVVYLYIPNCYDCRKSFQVWKEFKNELKAVYPDIAVFEVNVAENQQYDKYTRRFSPSVFPLVLTKSNGKVIVSDIIELYGSFSYDNLFRLVEETFFVEPVAENVPAMVEYEGEDQQVIVENQPDLSLDDPATALTVEEATAGVEGILRRQLGEPGVGPARSPRSRPSTQTQRQRMSNQLIQPGAPRQPRQPREPSQRRRRQPVELEQETAVTNEFLGPENAELTTDYQQLDTVNDYSLDL